MIALIACAAALIVLSLCAALPAVHGWQQDGYKQKAYFAWLRQDRRLAPQLWGPVLVGAVLQALILTVAMTQVRNYGCWRVLEPALWFFALALLLEAVYTLWRWKRRSFKKPLVFTARIKRLLLAMALLGGLVIGGAMALYTRALDRLPLVDLMRIAVALTGLMALSALWVLLQPYLVPLAGFITRPVEKIIASHYFKDAQRRLRNWTHMVKIGITGSYGKTSCKTILGTLLSQRYDTYITPHSYNTPMGVTRAVREQMTGRENVFIAEMGARQTGDIREMCELVGPSIGLITSVGPQHLETFGTVENVAKTKYELIEALPEGGWSFFPSEPPICLEMYRRTGGNKRLFGLDADCGETLFMTARQITLSSQGSTFELADSQGESILCATQLLGRHNILNIVGCAAVARQMGLSMAEIAAGVNQLEPVPHRLALVPSAPGITVIDDAFNASPEGTRAALAVLEGFEGRKVIVTPGMVELGEREEAENEDFGRRMAPVVDVAILVARNGESMARGLTKAGFDEGAVHQVPNLKEATAVLSAITRPGDVILFENDLPDNFEQ